MATVLAKIGWIPVTFTAPFSGAEGTGQLRVMLLKLQAEVMSMFRNTDLLWFKGTHLMSCEC